ncbi:M1 family metallopeptidase [Nocardia sp. AG03]|uniref:M1 family metallopeptidase n=1 Tax=Nocardia sp. AG03 TaxID=3025312 RepID=UPI002418ABF3|nr:M1 family metallopeptidase [Nocardia sp. AG03]
MRWSAGVCAAFALLMLGTGPAAADPALIGAPGVGDPYYPLDGNGGYDVTHYDLAVDYDPPTHQLRGTAGIEARAVQPLAQFNLDFRGPQVRMVTVNGQPAGFAREGEHELVVTPLLPLPAGLPLRIVVDYAGEVADTEGEGWTYAPSGGAFAVGQPHSASSWYPLNDTPLDKATFTLRASVPEGWEVMSTGERTRHEVRDGKLVTTWETRQPVIGYLTTMAVDHFTFLENRRADGTPVLSAFAPESEDNREDEQRVPEILDFLENLYGPYPFEVAGGIYVDAEIPFSLETQTRPTYAPWTDLNTVVHELAHQWWGDTMSVRQWSDICLNECFASYTADYLWIERTDGADVDTKYRETVGKYRDDTEFWEYALADPGVGNEFTSVYYRGPLFLHALRKLIGEDVFFAALKDFVTAHRDGHASMPEFREFLQTRTSMPLKDFLAEWLDGTRAPRDAFLYPGTLGD